MVSLAAYIEAQKLPVQMENVVEVIHRQWTVKPVSSKRYVVTSQPENSITPSHNSVGKPDLGLADSTAYTHRANGEIRVNMICPTTSYIARPCHYQDPHTGTEHITNTHMYSVHWSYTYSQEVFCGANVSEMLQPRQWPSNSSYPTCLIH